MPKVSVRDLKKRYDGVEAARGVSFEIRDGEIFGLIGPNGAGKTTTVECVIGLREPDEGAIEVCGIDARRRPREVKEKIGAALQTTALQEKITPREALALFGAFYRQSRRAGGAARALLAPRQGRRAVRHPVGRTTPAVGAGPRLRQQARAGVPRRADGGPGPPRAARVARRDREDEGRGAHGAPHDALPQRSRDALRPHRHHQSRPHHRHRHAAGDHRAVERRDVRPADDRADARSGMARERFPASRGYRSTTACASFRVGSRSGRVHATVAGVMQQLEARRIEIAELHVSKATLEDVFLELTADLPSNSGSHMNSGAHLSD